MHDLIKKARALAQQKHGHQTYGEIYPYYKHLEDVYSVLVEFGFSEEKDLDICVAAFLHDIMEDTATSFSDLRKEFGVDIAEIVFCVTDEMGRNRKEKKEKTYPKIRSNPKSVILKVADRIANVRFSKENGSGHFAMYQTEFESFQYELRIYKQVDAMWEDLTKLLE